MGNSPQSKLKAYSADPTTQSQNNLSSKNRPRFSKSKKSGHSFSTLAASPSPVSSTMICPIPSEIAETPAAADMSTDSGDIVTESKSAQARKLEGLTPDLIKPEVSANLLQRRKWKAQLDELDLAAILSIAEKENKLLRAKPVLQAPPQPETQHGMLCLNPVAGEFTTSVPQTLNTHYAALNAVQEQTVSSEVTNSADTGEANSSAKSSSHSLSLSASPFSKSIPFGFINEPLRSASSETAKNYQKINKIRSGVLSKKQSACKSETAADAIKCKQRVLNRSKESAWNQLNSESFEEWKQNWPVERKAEVSDALKSSFGDQSSFITGETPHQSAFSPASIIFQMMDVGRCEERRGSRRRSISADSKLSRTISAAFTPSTERKNIFQRLIQSCIPGSANTSADGAPTGNCASEEKEQEAGADESILKKESKIPRSYSLPEIAATTSIQLEQQQPSVFDTLELSVPPSKSLKGCLRKDNCSFSTPPVSCSSAGSAYSGVSTYQAEGLELLQECAHALCLTSPTGSVLWTNDCFATQFGRNIPSSGNKHLSTVLSLTESLQESLDALKNEDIDSLRIKHLELTVKVSKLKNQQSQETRGYFWTFQKAEN